MRVFSLLGSALLFFSVPMFCGSTNLWGQSGLFPSAKSLTQIDSLSVSSSLAESSSQISNDFSLGDIVNYPGKVEVSAVAVDKSPLRNGGFWAGFKNAGVARVDADGLVRIYGYDDGCRFVSVSRIVSTPEATVVLGGNGNLQFFNEQLNTFTSPVAKLVDDVLLKENYYYYLSGEELHYGLVSDGLAATSEDEATGSLPPVVSLDPSLSKALNESLRGSDRIKFFSGPSGQIFLIGNRNIWELISQSVESSIPHISRNTFLSPYQIVAVAFDSFRGLINHGFGNFSVYHNGGWDGVSLTRQSRVATGSVFFVNSRCWISKDGSLEEFVFDSGSDNCITIALPEPAKINAVAGDGDSIIWLGLSNGILYEYDCRAKYLSHVKAPGKGNFGSVEVLAFDGKALLVGSDKGLFHYLVKGKRVNSLSMKGAPVSHISAMKVISASRISASDGKDVYILDTLADNWTNAIINEPSDFISADKGGKLLLINKNQFSKWNIFPPLVEGRTRLDGNVVKHCDFFEGLAFYSTDTTVYRLLTKRLVAPAELWHVEPLFKSGSSRRWHRETITAMTTDAFGVVIANSLGEVKRISRFQGNGGHLSYVSHPDRKKLVTALANRGNTIFAAFNGVMSGIYSISAQSESLGGENEWKLLFSLKKKNDEIIDILPVGSWLVARGNERVYFFNLSDGAMDILDGSQGTYAGDCLSLTSYGKTIYLGGKGITKISLN
jgi:hypothetical protein